MKRVMLVAMLLLVASVAFAEDGKYYATISTTQGLPPRLVEQFRAAARTAGAEALVWPANKATGLQGCNAIIKIKELKTVAEIVSELQALIAATDVFADADGFKGFMVLLREQPR